MLGERLQEIRKDHGLSQQELADKLNVSIHTISSYERDRSAPDDDVKIEIAKLFNISLDYLLGLVDEPYPFARGENSMLLPEGFGEQEKKELREFIAFLHFKRTRKNRIKNIKK
ncbi:helix-turn-helix transcriptional regulator [Clostridium sp. D33t1_170424_F3]|uniref:helix-turn-helix domain-containing protein n=1 Tax=Clostridium sp. D33t1_170424_F3 TaxID=2787099 RepID=UPI0018A8A826|nr:helix-turn-helix transcriptional regulator [Clostridium sp. D33t1_170424_F3]